MFPGLAGEPMRPMHLFCLPGLQHDQRRIAADVSGVVGSIGQSLPGRVAIGDPRSYTLVCT
jgi:hypothetical protein